VSSLRHRGLLIAPARMKPRRWQLNPGGVDRKWRWAWDHASLVSPLWENVNIPVTGTTAVIDYVHRVPWVSNDVPSFIVDEGGVGVSFSNTSYRLEIAGSLLVKQPTTGCTILYIRKLQDVTVRASRHFGFTASGSGVLLAFVPWSDGLIYWDYGGSSGNNRLTWSGYTKATNIEYWAFTAGVGGTSIYFNGDLKASKSVTISRTASPEFRLNGATGPGDLQDVYLCAMFTERWSASQIAEWAQDPYGIIREDSPWRGTPFIEAVAAGATGQLLQIPHHLRGGFNSAHGGFSA